MADRRRANGPVGPTSLPVTRISDLSQVQRRKGRTRAPGELRKIFLQTGLTPSASGSAYLELQTASPSSDQGSKVSSLKLACAVHGPHPLPRSAPFAPQLVLSSRVKFAPFATRERRGYVPDSSERDLAAHLETAIRGTLIGERWPKSGLDIVITVLEGEDDWRHSRGCGMMSVLSGCITVASAAIADAGVDSVDLVTGGVAAITRQIDGSLQVVLDPCSSDEGEVVAACVVGYLQSRDEVTEVWVNGNTQEGQAAGAGLDSLIDMAIEAASAARLVLLEAIKESTEWTLPGKGDGLVLSNER